MELVIATRNPGKFREVAAVLAELGEAVRLRPLAEFPEIPEVPETGRTFEENAIQKARTVAQATGLPVLADDSGLEVDALGGAPGVHSRRAAGAGAPDPKRIAWLLRRLEGVPPERRTARFHCVVALAVPAPDGTVQVETFHGTVEGRILDAPRGTGGFGYDPVFLVVELGRSMAELSLEEKNRISHRARALRQALPQLVDLARWTADPGSHPEPS
jgi:XTP/dITP diphosphohydrolase